MKALILAIALGLLATPALAAPKPKPAATPKPAKVDKKKPVQPEGPADASQFTGDMDDSPEWFKKTDDAIEQLTDLVRSLPEGDVKATRMIQLAELYWQKSSRLHQRAMKSYNNKYDDWFTKDLAARGVPEPKVGAEPSEKESDVVMKKAIAIYEHVIKKFPTNPRGDQAHFYLGQSYLQMAEKDKAIATFKKLVERYPNSAYISDAYLGLGEFFFDNKKVDDAMENYKKAAKPGTKNYGYALYKLAWCYANKSDYQTALDLAKKVVQFSMQPGESHEYKDQALKDMINWYTEVGDVDGAEAYFKGVANDPIYYKKFLTIFGSRLFEQGRDDESIRIYRKLIALEPMGSENLSYEGEILKAFIRKADRPSVLAQLDRIVKMVDPTSPWVKQNSEKASEIKSQRDALEGTVSKYAREVYEEAKKLSADQKLRGLGQAEQFCNYYLLTFPNAKNAYPIRMMLGETQYALGQLSKDPNVRQQKYAAALDTYVKEVEADPKGEFLALAAENAIFATEEIVKIRKPSPRPDVKDKTARDIPGPEANIIRACDVYVKNVPKGPKAIPSRYKAAFIFYEFNQIEEATKRFADVIAVAPGSSQARFAFDLTLDTLNSKNDPAAVNAKAKEGLKIPALIAQKDDDGKSYRDVLQKLAEESSYKICELAVEKKAHADAAGCFAGFLKEYPSSDLADKAIYSMAVAYFEAGEVDKAIATREMFIAKFPKHERTPEVISYLASNHRKVADFDRAADYFEKLAVEFPKYGGQKDDGSVACDGLYNAAFFRENLGETQKAISNYRQYAKQCADRPDIHEVIYSIALIYEKKKDEPNAIKTCEEYIKTYGGKRSPDLYLDCQVRIADITYGNGKKKEAFVKYAGVIDSYRNLVKQKAKIGSTGLGAAAKSGFYVLEPKYDDYNAIKLDNKKTLSANIKKRLTLIKPLRDSYEKVVLDYKHGEWAVAALYQIGKMSDDFVVAIKSSPVPEELKTDAQKELYQYEIGEQFRPVEEAALEYYAKCVRTSAEYRIYNQFTQKSIQSLERLRPSQFVPDQEFRLKAGPNVAMFESSPIVEVK